METKTTSALEEDEEARRLQPVHHHRRDLQLTSTVRSVSVLAQALLVAGVGPDGRPGVRVLVDQILHTFPAAEAEESAANVNLFYPQNL